ncbi:MAG: adenylate kinase [Candidatus Tectomicrobia bacterium RIFCSPLOWO2_12_FULL_69_37]|nr:MAG: adenylate kinase [Candidatus Tectomicrobia bacterium RIFCSPLOWO2_02_FULL_70_19]OGL64736.1 MAG: adenylate kinase [Candidatus Tectomicrobia bacterium RIFCSPLOWO2_12_FULL_69_37]
MSVKLILLGPPGSGKGTQGALLGKFYGIPEISTGDMLRQAVAEGSELGKRVQGILTKGQLVPDDVMVSLVEERVSREDCAQGFILDGFPRTVDQARALERVLPGGIDAVVYLRVPREEVIARLAGRLTCRRCGAVYAKTDSSLCQVCGGDLYQRDDDLRSTVEHRLRVYEEHTAPLVGYYRTLDKVREFDGSGPVEEVARRVEAGIARVIA